MINNKRSTNLAKSLHVFVGVFMETVGTEIGSEISAVSSEFSE